MVTIELVAALQCLNGAEIVQTVCDRRILGHVQTQIEKALISAGYFLALYTSCLRRERALKYLMYKCFDLALLLHQILSAHSFESSTLKQYLHLLSLQNLGNVVQEEKQELMCIYAAPR